MHFFPFVLFAFALASLSKNPSSNAQVKELLGLLEGNISLKDLTEKVQSYQPLFLEEEIYLKTPNALRIDLSQVTKDVKQGSSKAVAELNNVTKLGNLVVVCVKQHLKTQDPLFVLTALLQVETLAGVIVRSDSYKQSLLLKQLGRCRSDILNLLTNATLYKDVLILSSYTFDHRIHELAVNDASVAAYFPTKLCTFEFIFEHFPFFIHAQHEPQFAVRDKLFVLLISRRLLRDCRGANIPEIVFKWFRCVVSVWQNLSNGQIVTLLLHVFENGHDNELLLNLFEPLLDDEHILSAFHLAYPQSSQLTKKELDFFTELANPCMKENFLVSRFPSEVLCYPISNTYVSAFGMMSEIPDVLNTIFPNTQSSIERSRSIQKILKIRFSMESVAASKERLTNTKFIEFACDLILNKDNLLDKVELCCTHDQEMFRTVLREAFKVVPQSSTFGNVMINLDYYTHYLKVLLDRDDNPNSPYSHLFKTHVSPNVIQEDFLMQPASNLVFLKGGCCRPGIFIFNNPERSMTLSYSDTSLVKFFDRRIGITLYSLYHMLRFEKLQTTRPSTVLQSLNIASPLVLLESISTQPNLQSYLGHSAIVKALNSSDSSQKWSWARDFLCYFLETVGTNPHLIRSETSKKLSSPLKSKKKDVEVPADFESRLFYALAYMTSSISNPKSIDEKEIIQFADDIFTSTEFRLQNDQIKSLFKDSLRAVALHCFQSLENIYAVLQLLKEHILETVPHVVNLPRARREYLRTHPQAHSLLRVICSLSPHALFKVPLYYKPMLSKTAHEIACSPLRNLVPILLADVPVEFIVSPSKKDVLKAGNQIILSIQFDKLDAEEFGVLARQVEYYISTDFNNFLPLKRFPLIDETKLQTISSEKEINKNGNEAKMAEKDTKSQRAEKIVESDQNIIKRDQEETCEIENEQNAPKQEITAIEITDVKGLASPETVLFVEKMSPESSKETVDMTSNAEQKRFIAKKPKLTKKQLKEQKRRQEIEIVDEKDEAEAAEKNVTTDDISAITGSHDKANNPLEVKKRTIVLDKKFKKDKRHQRLPENAKRKKKLRDVEPKEYNSVQEQAIQKPIIQAIQDEFKLVHHVIDKSNWKIYLPNMLKHIEQSSIISVDTETTGLWLEDNHFKAHPERFGNHLAKAKEAMQTRDAMVVPYGVYYHQVIQLGITCIAKDEQGTRRPFAVYTVNALFAPLTEDDFNSASLTFLQKSANFSIQKRNEEAAPGEIYRVLAQHIINTVLEKKVRLMFFNGHGDLMHLHKLAGVSFLHDRTKFELAMTTALTDVKVLAHGYEYLQGIQIHPLKIEDVIKHFFDGKFGSSDLHSAGFDSFVTYHLYQAITQTLHNKGYSFDEWKIFIGILSRPPNELSSLPIFN